MDYDELTQAQLDRLTEGFKKRIAELEREIDGGLEQRSNLEDLLETAAAKIESLEEQLAAFEAFFEGRPVAHPHDPTPTPPAPTFSVRRSYTENQDPRPPFIEIGLRRG